MEDTDDFMHDYDERNKGTCQTCANIFADIGETDAQYQDYHAIVPIKKGGRRMRTRRSKRSRRSKKSRTSRKSRRLRRK